LFLSPQMIEDDPELLSREDRLSAQRMANKLELLYKATREDIREAREQDSWGKIREAGTTTYAELHYQPRNEG
jgi:hypothetical protein